MPNILLFGCAEEFIEELAKDDRWSIAIGFHPGEPEKPRWADAVAPPPDPRHWQLIVDDCFKDNPWTSPRIFEEYGLKAHYVKEDYLKECERAHGIRMCAGREHFGAAPENPAGYKAVEFNSTDNVRAAHLIDFVDEFEASFVRAGLDFPERSREVRRLPMAEQYSGREVDTRPSTFAPLFLDSYDCPVVALDRYGTLEWLFLINIGDRARRAEALRYLCYRTAPKLWPDIYSDSFRPKRVIALMEEQARVISERRKLETELEQKIQEEQAFYAPFVNLLHIGDDALKELVRRVLEQVFSFEVEDLDEKLKEGEPKGLDLLVKFDGCSAFVEVRGSRTRNARVDPDIERFDDNFERSTERFGSAQVKILVFNGMYLRSAEEREKNPTFSQDVIGEAKARGIALISTSQLLQAIESFRNEEATREKVIEVLSQPGLVELLVQ